MACATCPKPLTGNDRRLGCRRCYACRQKHPGRLYVPKVTKHRDPHPYRTWNAPKPAKADLPKGTSWWIEPALQADRAAFSAKALEESHVRKARQSGPVLNELYTL